MCVGYLNLFDSHEAVLGRVTSGSLSVLMCTCVVFYIKEVPQTVAFYNILTTLKLSNSSFSLLSLVPSILPCMIT